MGIFEELAEEFGIGQDSPEARLAADLAAADEHFMCQLVELRRAAGLTQDDLGRAWGRHKTAVSQFERPGADPRLSTIRRYAASIGARYVHFVELDPHIHRRLQPAEGWSALKQCVFDYEHAAQPYQLTEPYHVTFSIDISGGGSSPDTIVAQGGRHRAREIPQKQETRGRD